MYKNFNIENQNDISEMANSICEYLVKSNSNNIYNAVTEVYYIFYSYIVKIIPEIDNNFDKIPLLAYMNLIRNTLGDLKLSEEQWRSSVEIVKKACYEYYT